MFCWIQAAVYTVRAGKGGARRVKARSCHAPARRLARTTISLGPEEGILFGLRAIRSENICLLPIEMHSLHHCKHSAAPSASCHKGKRAGARSIHWAVLLAIKDISLHDLFTDRCRSILAEQSGHG